MDTVADIGLIGLAVMGQNLALNLADHRNTVAVYNRTASTTRDFVSGPAAGKSIVGTESLDEMVGMLSPPRKLFLMVKAGAPVDTVIDELVPLLDPGDIIIDGGNSLYTDTVARGHRLQADGFLFIGAGVSGGEEGARHGPSIMPGGSPAAWPHVRDILQGIAARAPDGVPCCDWLGPGGAGHFVKMVHNGIEYGDMQVIAEAYGLMKAMGLDHQAMSTAFREWGSGVLDSFLVDITADILEFEDTDGSPLVEKILDSAGQKGTGKWTVVASMDLGQPVTLVAEAVCARFVSSLKDERLAASAVLGTPPPAGLAVSLVDIRDAVYASKIVSYAQGFMLLRAASAEHGWNLDLARIASLWREGCIIRAAFLDDITAAFRRDPELPNLLLDPFFRTAVEQAQDGWRRVAATAVAAGVPVPAYASALGFFDSYRSATLPANLIQAQRDFFGAHTYQRVDRPRSEVFHTNWTGRGGEETSGDYQA